MKRAATREVAAGKPNKLARIFDRLVATALGLVFLFYAEAKFSGNQFAHFELHDRVVDVDPVTLVWYFFGYSKTYAMFIACGELVAGLLVLIPWTARIGYPLYFGIAANVAVIDWSFGLPPEATWIATSLLVGSFYLLVRERRAYLRLLGS
jgi:uncharacterized membrane protein YphA (DoxX/SURF4 family)